MDDTPPEWRYIVEDPAVTEKAASMWIPVRCTHCLGIYDLGAVEVTARYMDCSMFTAPCCKREVDTRMWKSLPDYREIQKKVTR